MMPAFRFVRPQSVRDAVRELSEPGAFAYAGGTDLLGCMRDGVLTPKTVVAISGLRELRGIRETANGGLRIGSLTTLADAATHPIVQERYTALSQAAGSVASPQIRNQGTVGGNLCQKPRCWYFRADYPCVRKGGDACFGWNGENQFHCIFGGDGCFMVHPSDTAPAVVALNAQLHIAGPTGTRTIPAESFFVSPSTDFTRETILKPGEILTELILPPAHRGMRSSYTKLRARGAWDFALAGVALVADMENGSVRSARLVLSGVAPIPWRAREAEALLSGSITDQLASKAASAAIANAEPLAKNAYKVQMVRALIEDAVLALAS